MRLEPHYVPDHRGYMAGTEDGIVTVGGSAGIGNIYVFNAETLLLQQQTRSLPNGHYLVPYLNPARRYLIMGRHPQRQYEPICYDDLKPATALTLAEQAQLWAAWQL